jgi:FkbM family methyltransferase
MIVPAYTPLMERIRTYLRRRRAAAKFGLVFNRAATFEMPDRVQIGSNSIALSLPQERGVFVAFMELLLDDCYQLGRLAKGPDQIRRVLDIGANVGLFCVAARNAFPSAIIHAYEPNAKLQPYLAQQSSSVDAEVFYEAVGREEGLTRLIVPDAYESVHTSSRLDPTGTITQVSLRTAIDRIGGDVDLVKLDCEGAEWDMLEDREVWRKVRFVTMEYHLRDGLEHKAAKVALERCGFEVLHIVEADWWGGLAFARNSAS